MKVATLSVICVFMTLALALSVYGMGSYGGYGYGGYSYVPYYGGQQQSNPLGIGQGGLLMLFGFFFLFFLLLNGSLFNTTSSASNVNIIQG